MQIARKFVAATLPAAALTLCLNGVSVAAEEEGTFFGQDATGSWIAGVKVGVLQSDTDGFGDATNAGVVLGYRFSRAIGGIGGSSSVEFEFTTSVDDGDISSSGDQWSADTYALFFTYSTPGKVYFKGKLGGASIDQSSPISSQDNDSLNFAWGAGFGVKVGQKGKVELEYTGYNDSSNLDFISLGGLLEFR